MTRPTTNNHNRQQQPPPNIINSRGDLSSSPTVIYIGRLAASCTIQHLFALLNDYADVSSVCIPEGDQVTRMLLLPCSSYGDSIRGSSEVVTSERIAMATISSLTYAEQVVRSFDGHLFMGRFLR